MSDLPTTLSKAQSKIATQAEEIKRLTRQVTALKDDLSDIREQRDNLRDYVRKHCPGGRKA